jgi:NadR type nicotinamide-nucleotide adenylyltransferase
MASIVSIAVTGTESTGKSTLCDALAAHYHTIYVPEQSRIYLEQRGRQWQYEDVLAIARQQQAANLAALRTNYPIVFCDTELIAIKVWLQFYNLHCPRWIDAAIAADSYTHYLLMDIDMPWVADALRQNPNDRQKLFKAFVHELQWYSKPYTIVSGNEKLRTANAMSAINFLF